MNRRNRKKKPNSFGDKLAQQIKDRTGKGGSIKEYYFWQQLPRFHQRALMVLVPVLFLLFVLPVSEPQSDVPEAEENRRVTVDVDTTSLSQQQEAKPAVKHTTENTVQPQVTRNGSWKEYEVQSGDTLAKVFRANNLPMADLNALVQIEGLDKPLSKIREGQLVRYKLTSDGSLDILQLEKGGTSVMFFRLSDGGFGRSK
ncbi:lysine transporter LysM [Vibrio sp. HA2012]|uniref:LysM-like peptidoglycan-binding domain-containing protein n=1 Tax=Vibrio sp. HA2012 TaxID=1971595 RepID=UPI000C2CAED8|nr:LysM-like peptidoglycan-binding domain-containing protein [Vibrio sp. HA2012]PJC85776.1 lysine transporter LysM [Vibrio sp. HA2012]